MMRRPFTLAIFSVGAATLSLFCMVLLMVGWSWRGVLLAGRPALYSCQTIASGYRGQRLLNPE